MTVLLKAPGDEVTLTVSTIIKAESTAKKGTFRYQIDGARPDGQKERTYINEPVLDRELKHKGILDFNALVGGTFRFWRKAAPNNTPASGYLNVEVLTRGEARAAASPTPSKRIQPPAPPAPATRVPGDAPERYDDNELELQDEDEVQVYVEKEFDKPLSIMEQKEATIVKAYTRAWEASRRIQHGVGTPESVNAGAATILIALQKAGCC